MRRLVVVLIAILMLICLAACAHADGAMPAVAARAFKCPEPSGVVSLFCGVACVASLVYRKRR